MREIPSANVLVCVTDQLSCERLIRPAPLWRKNTASRSVSSAFCRKVWSRNKPPRCFKTCMTSPALWAQEMTFYFNNEPALTAAVHASQNGAIHIVSGTPGADSNLFIETVKGLLPELPMSLVDADGRAVHLPCHCLCIGRLPCGAARRALGLPACASHTTCVLNINKKLFWPFPSSLFSLLSLASFALPFSFFLYFLHFLFLLKPTGPPNQPVLLAFSLPVEPVRASCHDFRGGKTRRQAVSPPFFFSP